MAHFYSAVDTVVTNQADARDAEQFVCLGSIRCKGNIDLIGNSAVGDSGVTGNIQANISVAAANCAIRFSCTIRNASRVQRIAAATVEEYIVLGLATGQSLDSNIKCNG